MHSLVSVVNRRPTMLPWSLSWGSVYLRRVSGFDVSW